MLSEEQIEKLSKEFKEILRKGNTKELKSLCEGRMGNGTGQSDRANDV